MSTPTAGEISLQGKTICTRRNGSVQYNERALCSLRTCNGMVFQHFSLFPHMTVPQNVMERRATVLHLSRPEA